MNEKRAMFFINVIKSIINVYFDTFFVLYFFKVANYEIIPVVKYYLVLYFFVGVGFFLIRNAMKKNIKVPYLRIGISLQALYIATLLLLKENIINYIFLVGFLKGIADGFFHYPKNILETEKVSNKERQKFSGLIFTLEKTSNIVVPLLIGIILTYISYIELGKIFFLLFIVMFILSFYVNDKEYNMNNKMQFKKFSKLIQKNKDLRNSFFIPLLSGFTYSSGVMALVVTLTKINVFKTNLNLGFVDSLCAILFLLVSIFYTTKLDKKNFKLYSKISGIVSFITLIIFAFKPSITILIIYLFVRNSFMGIMHLISNNMTHNISNSKVMKEEYKAEYYLIRDLIYTISRCSGYLLLLIISLKFGISNINYVLIIPAISLLLDGYILSSLCNKNYEEIS